MRSRGRPRSAWPRSAPVRGCHCSRTSPCRSSCRSPSHLLSGLANLPCDISHVEPAALDASFFLEPPGCSSPTIDSDGDYVQVQLTPAGGIGGLRRDGGRAALWLCLGAPPPGRPLAGPVSDVAPARPGGPPPVLLPSSSTYWGRLH